MEPQNEPISVRVARINAEITGKSKGDETTPLLLCRETVLDALQTLYDECNSELLQKGDSNIAGFVKKYKSAMQSIRKLRVNVSDFEIKNIIGCGHFGEVHVVKEKQTGDIYAMKTIRKFDNEIKRMSFEEERNIMAYSQSPWLTSLQYSFQDSSYLFFVMDYHPGGDLLGMLYKNGSTLPESAAIFYIAEIILALEDLHNMGYVHRDVKPDNVLLDRCGHVKLADFGSAARIGKNGLVTVGPPVGTPDYIAPEVLQCLDNKTDKSVGYGVSCDFWSLGVLAYELVIGNPPFQGHNSTLIYSKIINHPKSLSFPADVTLSQGYVDLVKSLITEVKLRLKIDAIKKHAVFKTTNFVTLKDQVPPFVPKITSSEDTSNFADVKAKKKNPSIENFKRRSQFSGKNLPFVGFTFTPDAGNYDFQRNSVENTEVIVKLKREISEMRLALSKADDVHEEKGNLLTKLTEIGLKTENLESLRDKLEKQLSASIAECGAVKRTLEIERKDRINLEQKALELIKSAKQKWEKSEKVKIEGLDSEIRQLKSKVEQLTHTNQTLEEQLQHARIMEQNCRQSLETEQNLSRRSVVGLESLLEKATTERQNRIAELQSKLNEETNKVIQCQNDIDNYRCKLEKKSAETLKLENCLKDSQRDFENLHANLNENDNLVKQLNTKIDELEKQLNRRVVCQKEVEILKRQYDDSQKTIKDLQNKIIMLQTENEEFERQKQTLKEDKESISELQQKIRALEKNIESKSHDYETLQKRLEEAEVTDSKSQELREKHLQFYKLQKELSNCQLDKRILERELKDATSEIKELEAKLKDTETSLSETKKSHETAILELAAINEDISMELMASRQSIKDLQVQLELQCGKNEQEKSASVELKGYLKSKEEEIRNLLKQIERLKKDVTNLECRCKSEENEKSKLIGLIERLQKEKQEINESIEKQRTEFANMKFNQDALREACSLLESQVMEYEKLVEISKRKEMELNGNTEKLISDLCEARRETQEAKRKMNEEKSQVGLTQQRVKRMQEDIDCLEKECADYKKQCMEYKQYSMTLSDELTAAEQKLNSSDSVIKSQERQLEKLDTENRMLKKEISDYITKVCHLKETNCKLSYQIEETNSNIRMLILNLQSLEKLHDEKMSYYKEREMKAQAQEKQHLKLIDYLQTKIEESHKKKTITEVLFGRKENQAPLRDMEMQLNMERQKNKKLHAEILQLKSDGKKSSDIMSPRTKTVLTELSVSPKQIQHSNSAKRICHNIPHRFEQRLGTSAQKCAHCSNPIPIAKLRHVCTECKVIAHITCSKELPKSCGIPQGLIDHCKNEKPPQKLEESILEGWVKIPCPKSKSWQKLYGRLTQSSLDFYIEAPTHAKTPSQKFPLDTEGMRGKVILEPLHSEIDIPVATNDLPFIIKVEIIPETTCWPSKSLVIMTLNTKDKEAWFAALQTCIAPEQDESKLQTIVKLPETVIVNCVVQLTENIILLGTEQGLYAYHEDHLKMIEGISKVVQMQVFDGANSLLILQGPKSQLISSDVNHVINLAQCSKAVLKFKTVDVNKLYGFQMLEVSKYPSQLKIALSTPKQLLMLEYRLDSDAYNVMRILDTAQPPSCLLFTENSLIVGADKFYEIDTVTYQADEFLDTTDPKLKFALNACTTLQSFPIGIVRIATEPKEYLVTFNEFSIFVDEYGRSSREMEIKNQHLPIGIHFAKRVLYTVQFAAVEMLKITTDVCNSIVADGYRLEMNAFKYLGGNGNGIYLEQDGSIKYLSAKNLPEVDTSLLTEETESNRFSFSSSMMHSLDGHLSDDDEGERKVVRFEQTDF